MIDRESLDVVLERVQSGGRDDARLAHRAAKDLARAPRTRDELATAKQYRARRCAESLGEAARHRIEAGAQLLYGGVEVHGGIEDARAIEMRREAAALGERERLLEIRARHGLPADGVLQGEQARAREVRIIGIDRRLDL